METAAAVEKPKTFFHRSLQNACWRFAQFPQARRRLTTKPDRSLATKTGHFHLLPTGRRKAEKRAGELIICH